MANEEPAKWDSRWGAKPRNWDSMSQQDQVNAAANAQQAVNTKQSAKSQQNLNSEIETGNKLLDTSLDKYKDLAGFLGDATQEQQARNSLQEIAKEALERETKIRKTLVIDMGLMGGLQDTQNEKIQKAAVEAQRYGVEMDAVLRVMGDLSKIMGRNVLISDEDISRLAIFKEAMPTADVEVMVKYFDQMGFSVQKALDFGNDMAGVARGMGLNIGKFMDTITGNMKMMNTYNFADGVQGFARMAAQAQKLGLDMSNVSRIADDVMDPEGAISLAANLQVIGGAVGDLADPFKMMYMATNDLEGLQNAIVQAGTDLAVFNEETGEISFPPTSQRQLRALADELKIGKDELASMIKLQAKFGQMQNQFSMALEATPEVQEFVTSMANLNEDGKYEIDLNGDTVELEDLTAPQVEELKKLREQQMQKDKEMDSLTEKEILIQSRDALTNINNAIRATDTAILGGVASGINASEITTELNKAISKAFSSGELTNLSGLVGDFTTAGIETMFGDDINKLTTGISEVSNVIQAFVGTGAGGINDLFKKMTEATEKDFKLQTGYFYLNKVEGEAVNDFNLEPGETTAVLKSDGQFLIPSINDTVSGVDLTAGAKGANLGSLVNNVGSVGEKIVKVQFTGIPSRIPIELSGKNMGDFNFMGLVGNELFMQKLKSQLIETNLTTAPGMNNERELARYDSMT